MPFPHPLTTCGAIPQPATPADGQKQHISNQRVNIYGSVHKHAQTQGAVRGDTVIKPAGTGVEWIGFGYGWQVGR